MILRLFARRRRRRELCLLGALAESGEEMVGLDLAEAAGVPAGAMYPSLVRLERRGLITRRWLPSPYPRRAVYGLRRDRA